jgi:hypothetical protein
MYDVVAMPNEVRFASGAGAAIATAAEEARNVLLFTTGVTSTQSPRVYDMAVPTSPLPVCYS